jgi:purine-cytosine permease-like protein
MANWVLVILIGLVTVICGVVLIDFYLNRKRIDRNEAIMRIGGELDRYTSHMIDKTVEEMKNWMNEMMNQGKMEG